MQAHPPVDARMRQRWPPVPPKVRHGLAHKHVPACAGPNVLRAGVHGGVRGGRGAGMGRAGAGSRVQEAGWEFGQVQAQEQVLDECIDMHVLA